MPDDQDQRRFVWPPGPPGPSVPATDERDVANKPPGAITPQRRPWRSWVRDWVGGIEDHWLGRTAPPWHERARRAGWTPDRPGGWCPKCGIRVGPFEAVAHEGPAYGCPECRARRLPWARVVRLGDYTALLRQAILDTKFTAWRRLGHDLGRELGRSIQAALADQHHVPPDLVLAPADVVLVPVPTSFRRRLARGVDHTLAIARGVRAQTGIRIVQALRRSHRPPQVSVPSSERGRNVRGAMSLRAAHVLDHEPALASAQSPCASARPWRAGSPLWRAKAVLLVDDVMTTGATMREACRALRAGWETGVGAALEGSPPEGISQHARAEPPALWVCVLAVTADRRTSMRSSTELEKSDTLTKNE